MLPMMIFFDNIDTKRRHIMGSDMDSYKLTTSCDETASLIVSQQGRILPKYVHQVTYIPRLLQQKELL